MKGNFPISSCLIGRVGGGRSLAKEPFVSAESRKKFLPGTDEVHMGVRDHFCAPFFALAQDVAHPICSSNQNAQEFTH